VELKWCCATCISRGLISQRVCYLTLSALLFGTKCVVVITKYWSSNHFHHQCIGRQNKHLQVKYIPEWLRTRCSTKIMRSRPDFDKKMRHRQDFNYTLAALQYVCFPHCRIGYPYGGDWAGGPPQGGWTPSHNLIWGPRKHLLRRTVTLSLSSKKNCLRRGSLFGTNIYYERVFSGECDSDTDMRDDNM